MKLVEVLRKECVAVGESPADKSAALRRIGQVAKNSPILKDVSEAEILEGLQERESLGSTGFGGGIAIPHCRLGSVSDFVVGLITVPTGVDFGAPDKKDVKLIVFIIAPQQESNEHIRLLSAVSQTLLVPGAVEEILAGQSNQAVVESFLRHSRVHLETAEPEGKSLFHIFIQQEEAFRDILSVLAGVASSSLVILDAENAGAYLAKVPLFAGIWRDSSARFSRIIIAVVEKGLTNETIRRIEGITGDLNNRRDIMVTVQQIFYSAGSLNMLDGF
ncbi:MAG TPA: PTS sugar transporter subunit IIA [Planctomycetes bacterium]|nr:PTS sugar transporter subunit IIA [Planctomycetota bacterium]